MERINIFLSICTGICVLLITINSIGYGYYTVSTNTDAIVSRSVKTAFLVTIITMTLMLLSLLIYAIFGYIKNFHNSTIVPTTIRVRQTTGEKIKCPLCRTINIVPKNQNNVVGIEYKCSVCFDKNCEVFLPTCGHICLCGNCASTIATYTISHP